ncbi:9445_t:CDS:1, partial [Gigaspora rosea]
DTTFIASTQSDLQDILDKANEFYCINDIDINPKKSEIVVVNSRVTPRQQTVKLGREKAEVM